jgi:acyl-CoA synthetase (AMP-forming)/AMP-acid ligase II
VTAEAMTIDSVLRRGALTFSSRLAVCDGERILSYGELDAEVDALACALLELGVGKGDRVASLMFNQWQALVVYFATVRIGALIVPVNHRLVASEIAFQLNHADCSVLTYAEELSPVVGELRGTAQIRHWITVGSRAAGLAPGQDADYHLESLLGQYRGERPAAGWSVSGSDPSGVWYTSGTTGDPKGAVTTHSSALWAATTMALSMGLHERHRLLGVAPLFHRGPMEDFHLAGFLTGAPHYLMRHFDAAAMLRLIQEHRLTHGFIVPSMTFAVLTLPERGSYDLASMQGWLSASAPFPEEYRERLHRETTLPPDTVYNGYGITESLLNTSLWPQDAHAHPGSVGRAVPGVLLRVVDAERRPVPAGTVGEIAVAAPSMATTYLKNELAWQQATFATDRRTWYLSGDLGRLDDEGFLYIVDRAKDMVISGGENVYSAEVERALTALPGVVEACVVGLPDDRWGECVAALVVLAPGAAVTSGEIVAGCAARLARYKRPRRVFFVGSLPRNAFGKVRKQQVREQVAQLAAEAAC